MHGLGADFPYIYYAQQYSLSEEQDYDGGTSDALLVCESYSVQRTGQWYVRVACDKVYESWMHSYLQSVQ